MMVDTFVGWSCAGLAWWGVYLGRPWTFIAPMLVLTVLAAWRPTP